MVYEESYFGLPYVKCLDFVGLKCSCHVSDRDVSLLMSCKICSSINKDFKFAINSIWQVVYEEYEENGTEAASLGYHVTSVRTVRDSRPTFCKL